MITKSKLLYINNLFVSEKVQDCKGQNGLKKPQNNRKNHNQTKLKIKQCFLITKLK